MSLHPAVADKKLAPTPEPLPAPVIDAHTHLDACGAETESDVAAAMQRAAAVGVVGAVTVGGDAGSNRWSVRAAQGHEHLHAAVAIHPTEAQTLTDAVKDETAALAADPAVVAVGETGLDYYWEGTPHAIQQDSFAWHIELAKRVGKPLMVHDRLAHDDVLAILRSEGPPETVIFHCFSGDRAVARRCADAGYVMSFAGPVSFTNAPELRDAAVDVPLELIMVETDAPFLTPHPHRGRRNEPFALPYTVRALADIRGLSVESLCEAVRLNTARTYQIPDMAS